MSKSILYSLATSILIGPTLVFAQEALSATTNYLTELKVVELYQSENSVLKKLNQAESNSQKLNALLVDENYQTKLNAQVYHAQSKEVGVAFQPTFSPNNQARVSLQKNISIGANLEAGLFRNQSSLLDGTVVNDTQVGAFVNARFDLWKNIFGRLDRSRLASAEAQQDYFEKKELLQNKKNEVELRKLFWNLVAVEKNLELSQKLVDSAALQVKDAQSRVRAGVADRGELAKYNAQLESRRSTYVLNEYEKEVLVRTLKSFLTNLDEKKISFSNDYIKSQEQMIRACIKDIATQKAYNANYTFHDELLELLRKESQAELKVAQSHSDVDLALLGTYQSSGRANSEKDAIDNYNNDNKDSYSVTLQMSVPLGSAASKSEKSLVLAKQSNYNAQILQLENELTSIHEKLINSIGLLAKGLEIQQSNSKNLEINTAEVRRKFNQGRIPVVSLIAEQDLLFQSELQEINLKRQIAYAVLEYFTVFNQFPCSWNNLK